MVYDLIHGMDYGNFFKTDVVPFLQCSPRALMDFVQILHFFFFHAALTTGIEFIHN